MESVITGRANIVKEIKKIRGKTTQYTSRVDNEVGASNISEHFGNIYSNLYNRSTLGTNFEELCAEIKSEVGPQSLDQVNRVNEELVQMAINKMKSSKQIPYTIRITISIAKLPLDH